MEIHKHVKTLVLVQPEGTVAPVQSTRAQDWETHPRILMQSSTPTTNITFVVKRFLDGLEDCYNIMQYTAKIIINHRWSNLVDVPSVKLETLKSV